MQAIASTPRWPRAVDWAPLRPPTAYPGHVLLLDQTQLPLAAPMLTLDGPDAILLAIRTLQVRGAPAIGVAAAFGIALAAQQAADAGAPVPAAVTQWGARLAAARPTAVNLSWAIDRMRRAAAAPPAEQGHALAARLVEEALRVRDEDAAMCRAIGEAGATLLPEPCTVMTYCNAGALATAGWGTALAPIYVATGAGRAVHVIVHETRPLLQGARITAWELQQAGVPYTLITDNAGAHVLATRKVDAVLVGADRVAANGDAANKIGTYALAIAAHRHKVPFYVLAPTSTFDAACPTGGQIPIEERAADEIVCGFGRRTAPVGAAVYAPAFDVTPAALIAGIVCEHGVLRPPYRTPIRRALRGH